MEITTLSSGSHGNAYLIKANDDILLIEAGLAPKKLKKKLWEEDIYVAKIDSCLVSHYHQDHFKSVEFLTNSGVDVLIPSVEDKTGLFKRDERKDRVYYLEPNKIYKTANFLLKPFDLQHDDVPILGFMLYHKGTEERLFYATDTMYIKYQPKNIHYYMVEVNYQKKYLEESVKAGTMSRENMRRIMRSHMGLDTTVEFFKANDMSKVKEIHLLHLSERNANPEEVKETVQRISGVPVYIA